MSDITTDQMIDASEGLNSDQLLGRLMSVLASGPLDAEGFLQLCEDMRR